MFQRISPLDRPPDPEERSFFWAFVQFVIVVGLAGGIWYYFGQQVPEAPPTTQMEGKPPAARPGPPKPPVPKADEMITMESTDGRFIKAKVLVISDKTVFVRREDGATFDVVMDTLTPDTKARIEEYRLSRIFRNAK